MRTKYDTTVPFIKGALVNHPGWKNWQDYIQSKGYKPSPPLSLKKGYADRVAPRRGDDISLAIPTPSA